MNPFSHLLLGDLLPTLIQLFEQVPKHNHVQDPVIVPQPHIRRDLIARITHQPNPFPTPILDSTFLKLCQPSLVDIFENIPKSQFICHMHVLDIFRELFDVLIRVIDSFPRRTARERSVDDKPASVPPDEELGRHTAGMALPVVAWLDFRAGEG
ncbi:hypothetical protein QC762_0038440 [Podospora pseudocomata]|uniref:Uncharacterized protein n=1 Tax=Podospora pseudocomata TaxID=2093779 RepID=A0ABR0GLU6_9PEZI|nr:hypothetical protein QC762_0038440 [Podospora pseudocomata]